MSVDDLLQKAKWVAQTAKKAGANDARVTVSRDTESTTEWRNGRSDRVRESTSMSISVALFVDGRFSSSTTCDVRPEAIEKFIAESVGMTRALAPDPHRALADPSRYKGRESKDLQISDPAVRSASPDWRKRVASDLEAAARSAPGADAIISVSSWCSSGLSQSAKVTTNGMEGTQESTSASLGLEVSVRDKDGKKPEGYWHASATHMSRLPKTEEVGVRATQRALARIGSRPIKTGEYACVIENLAVANVLNPFLGALEGRNIQQKSSFLVGKLDKPVMSDVVTIVDNPHLPYGFGTATYDSEGMTLSPHPVIEKGILRRFYYDTYYARKLKVEPTSGTTTNLVFGVGKRDLDALLAEMREGLLITGFLGGNSNPSTGDFSFGIRGAWIKNGVREHPVSEMNLSGNHLTFWRRAVEVGSDLYTYSSRLRPSIRFGKVQFSGA